MKIYIYIFVYIYIHMYVHKYAYICNLVFWHWLVSQTHCNTLQLTATHCNSLQHTATHCNIPIAREAVCCVAVCCSCICILWGMLYICKFASLCSDIFVYLYWNIPIAGETSRRLPTGFVPLRVPVLHCCCSKVAVLLQCSRMWQCVAVCQRK